MGEFFIVYLSGKEQLLPLLLFYADNGMMTCITTLQHDCGSIISRAFSELKSINIRP